MFTKSCISKFSSLTLLAAICLAISVAALPPEGRVERDRATQTVDNETFINANHILMFVTNHGNFGRDLVGYFGYDYGTFYPFTTIDAITYGTNTSSPLYGAGIWLGGIDAATGDTLVTVSEYSSEFVPGPMAYGSYQTDRPAFRVYQLYRDSLAGNPNQDYLDWPVDQGAPVDPYGHPRMIGDQMLWTVYNDADPNEHDNNNGETDPMGIEVQQTVWASQQDGEIEIPLGGRLDVSPSTDPMITVEAQLVEPDDITGHTYRVETDSVGDQYVWSLIDVTLGAPLLVNQTNLDGTNTVVTDGFIVQVTAGSGIKSFECVANGSGPLDPPEVAAAVWADFPVPPGSDGNGYVSDLQQVGNGHWMIHTGDNGGTNGGGTRRTFEDFMLRTFREDPDRLERLGLHDWEIRFTGSNSNPGTGGGYAWEPTAFGLSGGTYWVPFELWGIGRGTPNDPSDDIRCIPYLYGDTDSSSNGYALFDLSNYGSATGGTCHEGCEHSVSGGDNDPYSDWIYWCLPNDPSPGEAAYNAFEAAALADPEGYLFEENEMRVMDRLVLVNWNGGEVPPFTQDLPELGTVFRMTTGGPASGLQFTISTDVPTPLATTGPEGLSIYSRYKLINKGSKTLSNFFICLWFDPDLGGASDDLIGCDTLNDIAFCYNATGNDSHYGFACPAFGTRVIEGPIVPSMGDTAVVDGVTYPNYRHLPMYSFNKYINGTDPDNYIESYQYMNGLNAKEGGAPMINPTTGLATRFAVTGDPVAGTGWIDTDPTDRRMMATYGPLDFAPGETQQILFKIAVGQGADRLSSITNLRQVLLYEPIPTDVDNDGDELLPKRFSVEQNHPNPFNPATTINYSLPERAEVEITILNVLGQQVAILAEGSKPAGDHSVVWKGIDDSGETVATGVYFYRVKAGDEISTRKMLLLK